MDLPQKKKFTESERAALAKKLDDDLDQFMEEMAARKSDKKEERKPFDFDDWCKEIDQHPAFMTEMPTDGKYQDTIEALQSMKYDKEDDEDKQMNAEHHKEEGNKHFKFKKYRWATDCYSNGIKENSPDRKLNAVLYFNRAAAQKHLGNLRSAIKDCSMGRKFDPTHLKGVIRGAECLLELEYAKDALNWIESSKKIFAFTKETSDTPDLTDDEKKFIDQLETLRVKSVELSLKEERDKRKSRAEERKETESKKQLLDALKERNLNLCPRVPFDRPELMDMARLTVSLPLMHSHECVKFDDDLNLVWPILLQYPEAGQTDVLTETNELTTVGELLKEVLNSPAQWDPEHKFNFENVRFFVSDEYDEYLMEVYEWNDFKSVLSMPGYQIKQGLPVIMIMTKEKAASSLEALAEDENRYVAK
ncbi:Cns1/TTC4 wheel domain-containing protein [Caenorhabditis elegans]|uniref:Cns1/TTC4 wheel domain-containing protein n=1 Tax=Caenorhabditis elegans TaxID=6239 RepID=Q09974_CAEEL|nr:Cns1/TTC4 wheel domain-containing protein [Caenorhabditis elegans]CCD64950.1 Cns1/TTC4 wheel domain-containing protein [Caenorhabditis elegans]|eukprot:NP_495087.1 TeTratriCopeptide repeat domain protein related [Caenorhabditis elegans]